MQQQQQPRVGPGGVPEGSKTSEYYRTKNIPDRFENPGEYNVGNPVFTGPETAPTYQEQQQQQQQQQQNSGDVFQGYNSKPKAPMYRTSNSDYGSRAPSVHTMPTTFYAKSQEFTEDLGKTGMYRNHSLNCSTDKSVV